MEKIYVELFDNILKDIKEGLEYPEKFAAGYIFTRAKFYYKPDSTFIEIDFLDKYQPVYRLSETQSEGIKKYIEDYIKPLNNKGYIPILTGGIQLYLYGLKSNLGSSDLDIVVRDYREATYVFTSFYEPSDDSKSKIEYDEDPYNEGINMTENKKHLVIYNMDLTVPAFNFTEEGLLKVKDEFENVEFYLLPISETMRVKEDFLKSAISSEEFRKFLLESFLTPLQTDMFNLNELMKFREQFSGLGKHYIDMMIYRLKSKNINPIYSYASLVDKIKDRDLPF